MDIKFENDNYRFILRSSVIIFNKTKDKVLLFKSNNKENYSLIGGKIKQYEFSLDTIKREVKEEIGFDNLEYIYKTINEDIISDNEFNNQIIEIIYEAIYDGDIKNNIINSLEGNWCHFEWINISDLEKIKIIPKNLKDII